MQVCRLLSRVSGRLTHWQRRSAALLVLVLQAALALSPLTEHADRRTVTHAEQRGTRHAPTHNETTCTVCAVRALQATAAARQDAPTLREVREQVATVYGEVFATRDPPTSNGPRAPPPLS